jgi:hypothetical protein
VDDRRVAVHDWLDRNPSRGAIGGRLGAMKADGKRGNHKRWGHPGDIASCPKCNPSLSQVVAEGDRPPIGSGLPTRSHPIARDRDRDIYSDRTVAAQSAARSRAVENTTNVRAMLAENPPNPAANVAHTGAAREAMRQSRQQPRGDTPHA